MVAPTSTSTDPVISAAFQRPNLLISAPMPMEAAICPTTIGRVSRPDSVGFAPRASCMYWARKTLVPNMATPTERLAMTARVKVRLLNIVSGTIGSFTTSSVITKAIRARAAPPTISQDSIEFHSNWWPPMVTQISSSETPALSSTAPK